MEGIQETGQVAPGWGGVSWEMQAHPPSGTGELAGGEIPAAQAEPAARHDFRGSSPHASCSLPQLQRAGTRALSPPCCSSSPSAPGLGCLHQQGQTPGPGSGPAPGHTHRLHRQRSPTPWLSPALEPRTLRPLELPRSSVSPPARDPTLALSHPALPLS